MSKKLKKIGIFGGSFDPPHLGHLVIAELARRSLKLDLVVFVPAYRPPHKLGNHPATARDRLRMTKLATRGNKRLRVSDVEVKRRGVSYTVDTILAFRRRHPSATLYLIIGSDSLRQFHSWKNPDIILQEAELAVYRRPGSLRPKRRIPSSRIHWIEGPTMDLSSSDIRKRIEKGRTIRYMVRDNVLGFVESKRLYSVPR